MDKNMKKKKCRKSKDDNDIVKYTEMEYNNYMRV